MSNKHYLKYFSILEIDPDVPFSEVRSSYLHLRELYSNKSAVLSTLMDQIYKDRQKEILNLLKDAYNNLKEYYAVETREKLSITKDTVSQKRIPEFEVFSGNALRLIREVLEIELEEVALATGIPRARCERVNLGYLDPAEIDVDSWVGREDEGILVVPKAGEMLFKIRK